jgi:hypothetical protein
MRALLLALGLAACGSPAATSAMDLAAPSSDTWSNFAQAFFASYCTRCHPSASDMMRDYTQYAQVARDQSLIACGVSPSAIAGCPSAIAPSQFPIGSGPHPSDAERNRLVAWIAAGAPQ